MLRKVSILASVIGIAVAVTGVPAQASRIPPPAPVNAANYTVSCSSFVGALHFKPSVRGNLGPFSGTVKGAVTGCSAEPSSGGAAVDIVSGKVAGPITFDLTDDQGDCGPFIGVGVGPTVYPVDATLTVVWKTAKGTPTLSSGSSVVQLTNVASQAENPVSLSAPGAPGGIGSTGSFTGEDRGSSGSLSFGGESAATAFDDCTRQAGMPKLTFRNAIFELS
jgi:hypothetical protein